MSRVGKKPINIPAGTTVNVTKGNVEVVGPLGRLSRDIHRNVLVSVEQNELIVSVKDQDDRAIWGTTRSVLNNVVQGVSIGFKKELEIVGVGYRMVPKGRFINLSVGKSHGVKVLVPEGIKVTPGPQPSIIVLESIDKELLGQFAKTIKNQKPREPFKGKGIGDRGEIVKQKVGKKGK